MGFFYLIFQGDIYQCSSSLAQVLQVVQESLVAASMRHTLKESFSNRNLVMGTDAIIVLKKKLLPFFCPVTRKSAQE